MNYIYIIIKFIIIFYWIFIIVVNTYKEEISNKNIPYSNKYITEYNDSSLIYETKHTKNMNDIFPINISDENSLEKSKIDKNIQNNNIRYLKDILFVNGCNMDLYSHSFRYRVIHQMEQLNAGFLETDENFYLHLKPSMIRNYRVIIFFRCPWTEDGKTCTGNCSGRGT